MALAQDSTLDAYSICGTIGTICPEDPANIRVTVDLINPGNPAVKDPTNDTYLVGGRVYEDTIVASEDGCWCTCPLVPNIAADETLALQPNTTAYRLTVFSGAAPVIQQTFQINAEDFATLPTDTSVDCGDCINISEIIGDIPQLPAPPTFCEVVDACVAGDLDAINAQIAAFTDEDTIAVFTANPDGTITLDPGDGTTPTVVPAPITDAGTTNTTLEMVVVDGELTATVTDSDGNTVTDTVELPCWAVTCATDPATNLAVIITITDGAAVYTNPDGTPFVGDPTTLI